VFAVLHTQEWQRATNVSMCGVCAAFGARVSTQARAQVSCAPNRAPRNAMDLKLRDDRYLMRIQNAHHDGTVVPLRTSRSCSQCNT